MEIFFTQFEKTIKAIKLEYPEILSIKISEHIAPKLNRKFGVSDKVGAKRLLAEKIL